MANEEIAHVDEGILAHLGVEEELVPLLQLLQVIGRWQISIRRRRHPYFKDDPVIVNTLIVFSVVPGEVLASRGEEKLDKSLLDGHVVLRDGSSLRVTRRRARGARDAGSSRAMRRIRHIIGNCSEN